MQLFKPTYFNIYTGWNLTIVVVSDNSMCSYFYWMELIIFLKKDQIKELDEPKIIKHHVFNLLLH